MMPADVVQFAGRYSIGVNEGALPSALKPTAPAGTRQTLAAANYVFRFSFEPFSGRPNTYLLTIYNDQNPTVAYFLPYKADCAIEMQLGNAADHFFTSTLTGCSVQAFGNVQSPMVTHANGRTTYTNAYQGGQVHAAFIGLTDDKAIHDFSEGLANSMAQGYINGLLPPTGGAANVGTVTKMDYGARLTPTEVTKARKDYYDRYAGPREFFTKFDLDLHTMSSFGVPVKPQLGCFVFGIRHNVHGWRLWYQSTTSIKAQTTVKGQTTLGRRVLDEVVLGPAEQFFP